MLSLLFAICMIWFVGKFFVFGLRASWGIMKVLCTVIFFPVILIGMVVGGLMYIAFPSFLLSGLIEFSVLLPSDHPIYILLFCWYCHYNKFIFHNTHPPWGIMKLLCTVIFFPVILIGMVIGGLMYIAFPLLIVGGIIALVTSHS